MGEHNESIRNLRSYLHSTKGTRYPLNGHVLASENEKVARSYLIHLWLVASAGSIVTEEQQLYLQRLAASCGIDAAELNSLRLQIEDITHKQLEAFFASMEERDLRYAFILDALILVHLGDDTGEQDAFAAELCEAMRIRPEEIEEIAAVATNILKMDIGACVAHGLKSPVLRADAWLSYLPEDLEPIHKVEGDTIIEIGASRQLTTVRFSTGEMVDFCGYGPEGDYPRRDSVMFSSKRTVVFINLNLSLDVPILFDGLNRVEFIRCKFRGTGDRNEDSNSLWFNKCDNIRFLDCEFRNFRGRVAYAYHCNNIAIERSSFQDCIVKYYYRSSDWRSFGGILFKSDTLLFQRISDSNKTSLCISYDNDSAANRAKLRLEKCSFINCGGCNSSNYYVSALISNCPASITGCRFENCWHLHSLPLEKFTSFDADNDKKDDRDDVCCTLFETVEHSSDNVIINAPRLAKGE